MIERVFIQRSRLGRRVFALRDDRLEITERHLGQLREARIPLRSISPEYELRSVRLLWMVVLLLLPVGLSVVTYKWLQAHPALPDILHEYPLFYAVLFTLGAMRMYRRFEVFVFRNHFNKTLFTILREPGQKAECEAFVHTLLDRIEALNHDGEGPLATGPVASDEEIAQADDPNIASWKLAVGLSLISIVVPPAVNWLWPDWDGVLLPLVIVCSGGAVFAAIHSFTQKESGRWWAVIAAVLGVIPVLFY